MLGRISPPRVPRLGALQQLSLSRPQARLVGECTHKSDVGGRKGIGLTHPAQRDVLRSPQPTPGRAFNRSTASSRLRPIPSKFGSFVTADARPRNARTREGGIPSVRSSFAIRSLAENACVRRTTPVVDGGAASP